MKGRNVGLSDLLILAQRSMPGNLWGQIKRDIDDLDVLSADLLYCPNFERDFLDE